jgi:hypothetical protein
MILASGTACGRLRAQRPAAPVRRAPSQSLHRTPCGNAGRQLTHIIILLLNAKDMLPAANSQITAGVESTKYLSRTFAGPQIH